MSGILQEIQAHPLASDTLFRVAENPSAGTFLASTDTQKPVQQRKFTTRLKENLKELGLVDWLEVAETMHLANDVRRRDMELIESLLLERVRSGVKFEEIHVQVKKDICTMSLVSMLTRLQLGRYGPHLLSLSITTGWLSRRMWLLLRCTARRTQVEYVEIYSSRCTRSATDKPADTSVAFHAFAHE